ncbi:MAG: hypothetical protein MI924_26490 [Chloroflexales bacterium]|nr:hypothetical protein [Chloroflexales bacterium]
MLKHTRLTWTKLRRRRLFWTILLVAILGGYWLLPIRGQIVVMTDPERGEPGVWPQVWIEPPATRPGDDVTLYVRDATPWAHVKLLIDGVERPRDENYPSGDGPWTWRWQFSASERPDAVAAFYHDCHTGCIKRAEVTFGGPNSVAMPSPAPLPTKLGLVFADFSRDWHGRAAWTMELTYAERQTDEVDFSIDGLARRVQQATKQGLRVLVRVAFDRQQALPPADDEVALGRFLDYCARLARDDRLQDVYGYIIGSGFNRQGENQLAPGRPTTPEWYARIFNGYQQSVARRDNIVQVMRSVRPQVRILVGPVTPWNQDQSGSLRDPFDQPWLNYFNTLVAHLDTAAQTKARAGYPLGAPDGFAFQAPGRPDSPHLGVEPAQEPATDLYHPEWGDAQAGFRVYRDWLAIVNRYPSTRGLPAYISSTNTFTPDTGVPPAQNYPLGWLTTALDAVNSEPQLQALTWFVDMPLGGMWNEFSMSRPLGRMHNAVSEFDLLLQQ